MRAHRAVHRLEDVRGSSRLAGDLLAADEMPVFDHVPLPDVGCPERFMRHDFAHSNFERSRIGCAKMC